jgi:hypothetical protein
LNPPSKADIAATTKCANLPCRIRGAEKAMRVHLLQHWTRALSLIAIVLAMAASPVIAAIPEPAVQTADQRAVLAADERQREAVASANTEAITAIADPNLRVNAPNNRVLTREDLVRMVASGEIRNEVFSRTAEDVIITGDVGVVMGHEEVFPGAGSEQARMYGQRTLTRRYTNVYIRRDGAWYHLARHANIIPETSAR